MEKQPKEPNPENLETEIERLLKLMEDNTYLFPKLAPKNQEWWYEVEMETKSGKDRQQVLVRLKEFADFLLWTKERQS